MRGKWTARQLALRSVERLLVNSTMNFRRRSKALGRQLLYRALDMSISMSDVKEEIVIEAN